MNYDKLIRDKIPEINKKNNKYTVYHVADDNEYWEKLKLKLHEEVDEFLENEDPKELADLIDVIYAICDKLNINKEDLENLRLKKCQEMGEFKNKIILDEL